MLSFLLILLALGLVLLNAFFVAAEFGIVKLRDTRVAALEQNYGFRGRILGQVHRQLDAYLSACQLGITLASLGLGWIGEPAIADVLEPVFKSVGITSHEVVTIFAFFTAFTIISFLHIVMGELMPKSLAIRKAEMVSLWTAVPLYSFYWLMYPAIWLLNHCSNFLLKKMGAAAEGYTETTYSTEEIKLILSASHAYGELTRAETDIINRTLNFADLTVSEVMRPYEAMIALDLAQPMEQLLKIIFEHRYSRYPVYEQDKENILGVIHVKDLFFNSLQQLSVQDFKALLRPVLKISPRLSTLELLRQFREGSPHFALAYSAKQTLVGFITLDNLLRVMIGRIQDEFHDTQDDWVKNPDGSILLRGSFSLYTLEKVLGYKLQRKQEETKIYTFTGLVLSRLGMLPTIGERIAFDEFEFTIQKMHGARVIEVMIYPKIFI